MMGAAASTAGERRVIRIDGTSGSTSDSLQDSTSAAEHDEPPPPPPPPPPTHLARKDKNVSQYDEKTSEQTDTSSESCDVSQEKLDKAAANNKQQQDEWRKRIDFGHEAVENLKKAFLDWPSQAEDELLNCLLKFSSLYSKLCVISNREKQRFCKREFGREMLKLGAVDTMSDICIKIISTMKKGSELSQIHLGVLDEALVNLLNLTDESVDVSERVCQKEDLLEVLAECMICQDMETWTCAHNVIGVVYNCSRRASNRDRLRSVGFSWMLRRLLFIKDNIKIILVSVALAGILTDEESKLFQIDDRAIRVTHRLFLRALSFSDHRHDGMSACELAEATSRIAISDSSKKVLLDHGFLDPLHKLCDTGDNEEQAEGLSALWTMAFHGEVRKTILSNKNLVNLIISLGKSADDTVKTRAANILWTLRENLKASNIPEFKEIGEKLCRKPKKDKFTADSVGHIMISYQWLVKKEIIFKLQEHLEAGGYRVWIDRQEMKGSMTEAMALAVEESDVFLMCISQNYKQSDNCRAEAEYAYFRKKHIIPILMDSKYVADGWLGLIKGLKKHYDFSDEEFFGVVFDDLLKEIGVKGKGLKSNQPAVISGVNSQSGHGGAAVSEVPNWSVERVRQWLKETGCAGKSLQNLTGKQLLFIKRLRKEAPEYFYHFLDTKLRLRDINELTTFADALTSLH